MRHILCHGRHRRAHGIILVVWRRARARGELAALTAKKRGRKPTPVDPRDRKIAELERQLAEMTGGRSGPKPWWTKNVGSAATAGDRAVMIALVKERRAQVGIGPPCKALGLARATFYERGGPPATPAGPRVRRPPRQTLTAADRAAVLTLLHKNGFVDLPLAQVRLAWRDHEGTQHPTRQDHPAIVKRHGPHDAVLRYGLRRLGRFRHHRAE
jgi:hypothetical protein